MDETNVPLFVKIGDYKEVVAIMDSIKERLAEARHTLETLKALKDREDAELGAWEATISDAEARIDDVDRALVQQNVG